MVLVPVHSACDGLGRLFGSVHGSSWSWQWMRVGSAASMGWYCRDTTGRPSFDKMKHRLNISKHV